MPPSRAMAPRRTWLGTTGLARGLRGQWACSITHVLFVKAYNKWFMMSCWFLVTFMGDAHGTFSACQAGFWGWKGDFESNSLCGALFAKRHCEPLGCLLGPR